VYLVIIRYIRARRGDHVLSGTIALSSLRATSRATTEITTVEQPSAGRYESAVDHPRETPSNAEATHPGCVVVMFEAMRTRAPGSMALR
jgi:hypothetical protein